jgi:hypothetical protein
MRPLEIWLPLTSPLPSGRGEVQGERGQVRRVDSLTLVFV